MDRTFRDVKTKEIKTLGKLLALLKSENEQVSISI